MDVVEWMGRMAASPVSQIKAPNLTLQLFLAQYLPTFKTNIKEPDIS